MRTIGVLVLGLALAGVRPGLGQAAVYPLWAINSDRTDADWDLATVGNFLDRYYLRGLQASVEGEEVASLGDINEDGRTDFIVGQRFSGRAAIYSGRTVWSFEPGNYPEIRGDPELLNEKSPTNPVTPEATTSSSYGFDVANVFDINGDGTNEYVVSAPDNGGAVYLYDGATHVRIQTIVNQGAAGGVVVVNFGWSVAGLGDVDGGGKGDIAIGAPEPFNGGHVFIFLGEQLPLAGATIAQSSAFQAITMPAYAGSVGGFGGCVAAGGDVDGDGDPDGLIVGAPTTDVGLGASALVDAGVAVLYHYLGLGATDPCTGVATTTAGFKLRCAPGTSNPIVLEGRGHCSHLGFDISLVGIVNHDLVVDFVVGAMGRSPLGSDCFPDANVAPGTAYATSCGPSAFDDGYAEVYSGANGQLIAMSQGQDQLGDQARYGAYVAGDIDLDADHRDCDLDLSGKGDVLVSSYRRKPFGGLGVPAGPPTCAYLDTAAGSLNVFDGSYAGASGPPWVSPHVWTSPYCALFTPGGAVANGWSQAANLGEALAWLPCTADYPRIACFERGPAGGPHENIRILTFFGHATIPDAESLTSAADPVINWMPGGTSLNWPDGSLEVRLSATAHLATEIFIVPSLSLANVSTPTSGGGVRLNPPIATNSAGSYPIYPLVFTGAVVPFPIFGASRIDFDATDWMPIVPPGTASSQGTPLSLPFSITSSANTSRYPNHPLAQQRGAHLYLQVFELYEGELRASNLLILRMNPDQALPTSGPCP